MLEQNVSTQLNIRANVKIGIRNKTTNVVRKTIEVSNRVTNGMLSGIANLLYGNYDVLNKYIPAYVALGDCTVPDTAFNNVSALNVEVTDTKLFGEIPLNTDNRNERIVISSKGVNNNNDYISITMKAYIQSNTFNGKDIKEVGLFTKHKGNNCLARVILDEPINKTLEEIIDITWSITVTSV